MRNSSFSSTQSGFVGSVSGLSLADIIQVKGSNHYSGCLIVEHAGNGGLIFFRDGEVVHAEQGQQKGEEAFYAIMGWAEGSFRSEPKVLTTCRSIEQSINFLILESFHRIDARKNPHRKLVPEAEPLREDAEVSTIQDKFHTIPEVEKAVVMTKAGSIIGDNSYQAECLGAKALFVADFAGRLGIALGTGDFRSALVHGREQHLFIYSSRNHQLCLSAPGDASASSLDAAIRRIIALK